jgi:hypothetical protein
MQRQKNGVRKMNDLGKENRRLQSEVTYNPETEQPIFRASPNLDTPVEIKCNADISSSYSQHQESAKGIIKIHCRKMIRKNLKDLRKGRPMRFTKGDHTMSEGFDAWEAKWWNKCLPDAEQYTKEEHTNTKGFSASNARWWNFELPNAEQYTKEEHTNAEGFIASNAIWWNRDLPNAEQYTKEEHTNTKGFSSFGARMWNTCLPDAEQYTKEEHSNTKGFYAYEARAWNVELPNAEQYTEEEIKVLKELGK